MGTFEKEAPSSLRQRKGTIAKGLGAVHDFIDDEFGSYLVFLTLLLPVLIGLAGLGTEGAYMLTQHRAVQAAADSAAVSVASYYAAQKTATTWSPPTNTQLGYLTTQAEAVAATYGFDNGTNGAAVKMNYPPTSGNFTNQTTYPYAFEVIVSQSHTPLLSSYWLASAFNITARAVALINATTNGSGGGSNANCILALGNSSGGSANLAEAIWANGNARLNLQGCSIGTNSSANGGGAADAIYFGPKGSAAINLIKSNLYLGGRVSAVGGVSIAGNGSNTVESCTSVSGSTCNNAVTVTPVTGVGATPNPDAGVTIPTASLKSCSNLSTLVSPWSSSYMCVAGNNTSGLCFSKNSTNLTLSPGTYCGGISISQGNATYTLNPGVYILASTNSSPGLTDSKGTVTMNGTGVTLVFTSADGSYPSASNPIMNIPNAMTLNLTAPTTGSTAEFVDHGRWLDAAGHRRPARLDADRLTVRHQQRGDYGPQRRHRRSKRRAELDREWRGEYDLRPDHSERHRPQQFGNAERKLHHGFIGGIGAGSLPTSFVGAIPLLVE